MSKFVLEPIEDLARGYKQQYKRGLYICWEIKQKNRRIAGCLCLAASISGVGNGPRIGGCLSDFPKETSSYLFLEN